MSATAILEGIGRSRTGSRTASLNQSDETRGVALRDFGLLLGALTLARLASKYDSPGLMPRLRRGD